MSVLSASEQEIFDVGKASIPRFFFSKENITSEIFAAASKAFGLTRDQIDSWLSMTLIGQATGFWLDQHAIDRNTRRRSGEGDATLSERIRTVDDAVTYPVLVAKINAILSAASIAGVGALIELRPSAIHFGSRAGRWLARDPNFMGNGDNFKITDSTSTVTTVQFWVSGASPAGGPGIITVDIRTATTPEDVATAVIGALQAAALPGFTIGNVGTGQADTVYFEGPSPGRVPIVTVDVTHHHSSNIGTWTPQAAPACNRGFRIARYGTGPGANELIAVLPFGTTVAVASAVSDTIRQYKGGGIRFQVEVRGVP